MFGTWRTVRVFLSSTFRDMHAERDHLVKVTFPHLRQWCAERRLHLVDVDLRWGVPREEPDGRAVAACLDEVDACRPFFLCLLGGRYGWVPAPDDIPAEAFARFPGLQHHPGRSVTHLEILHAVEGSLGPAPRPPCSQVFCYFRRPECLPPPEAPAGLTEEERRAYRGAFFEQDPRLAGALSGLKESLRRRFAAEGRVFDYAGAWDAQAPNPEDDSLRGRLTRLDEFGDRVAADLQRAIAAEFAGHIAALDRRDPLAEERSLHEAFLANRTRVHVPRADVEERITRHVESDDARPLVVSGPPGTGKSALLAHWARQREGGAGEVLLARFIGASPASSSLHRLLAGLAAELVGDLGLTEEVEAEDDAGRKTTRVRPLEVASDPARLRQQWPGVLAAAGRRGRVVLLLDALEQLDRSADPAQVGWLPRPLPAGVRLVVSVLDPGGRAADPGEPPDWLSCLRRLDLPEVAVPPLSDDDRRRIIHELPGTFCKTLDPEQTGRLLENQATRNVLFLTVALEELRLQGSLEKLPAAVAGLPQLDDPEVAGNIDRALDRLFGQVLERLEQETRRQAPDLVPALFCLLAASRDGLSEQELQGALARRLPHRLDAERAGTLQVVLRQVRPYLMRKGLRRGTLVDFYHRSFWKAARARYLADPASRRQAHRDLGDYFREQPDAVTFGPGAGRLPNERKLAELPWQLLQAACQAGPDLSEEERLRAWDPPARLLGEPSFLEAKAEAGLVGELVADFADVLELMPERHPRRPLLRLLDEALRADLHFLARHPEGLFSCLWDRGWWYDGPEAARHYEATGPGPAPWERPAAERLAPLLEAWRADREAAAPGRRWARRLHPPADPLGAAQRAVLRGHEDMVTCVAFAPDGRRLASAALDRTARVWDVRTGAELLCLRGHGAGVLAVLFAPDGRHVLAAAADQSVRVWDAQGGELACLPGPKGTAVAAAFSADGRRAAFACSRGVLVRDTATGGEVAVLQGHRRPVVSVACSPDGRHIAAAAEDDTLRLWDADGGRELLHWQSRAGLVWSLAFAADGRRLVSGGGQALEVWDPATGRPLACLRGHTRSPLSVAWSPDGRHLVSGGGPGENAVRVWDVDAGRELACLRGHPGEVRAVAFSPDGRHVASGGGMLDNTVRVWEARGGSSVRPRGGHEGPVKCVVFSPDGKRLASGGGMFDNTLRLWDAAGGGELACLRGHKADVGCVTFSPDGRLLASGSRDRTLRLWDVAGGRELACLRGHLAEVRGVAFAPDGQRLVSGGRDRTARVWDVGARRELLCLRGSESEIWGVAFSPDGRRLVSGSYAGAVRVWDAAAGAVLASWQGHDGVVAGVAYSPDGGRVVSFGADETVRTWDAGSGACLEVLAGVAGLGDVAPLAAGPPRFPWRAVTRGDETVIEDAATGEAVARLPVALARIATHPSGRTWAGVETGRLYFADRSQPCLFTLEGA
jgi:WD40 repeat protein